MEVIHYGNSYRSHLENPRYVLLLVDSVEAKDRVHALEILGQLLKHIVRDSGRKANSPDYSSLKISISFSILTRCDDISPSVRAKALNILSQNMRHILKILNEAKTLSMLEIENIEDVRELDLDVNGNHRYFWYLRHDTERRKELEAVLHRRTSDHYVSARKAAFTALANAMMLMSIFATKRNLACLRSSASDVSATIRKQAIQLASALLETRRSDPQIQALWLKCVLPLTDDVDISVDSKALSALEEAFLQGMFSPQSVMDDLPMILLKMLSSDEFLPYQKFLKNAFVRWKSVNKLKTEMTEQLKLYIGTQWEECVWFYVSNFASHHPIPDEFACLCVEHLRRSQQAGEHPSFMVYVLEVLLHAFQSLPPEILDAVHGIIQTEIETFSVPLQFVPMYTDILFKIHKHKETKSEFDAFSFSVIQKCLESLSEAESNECIFRSLTEDLLIKMFCTMSELCLLCPSHVTTALITILKTYSSCTGTTETQSKSLSSKVNAHAFVALSKICLLDESIALELLSVIAEKMLASQEDIFRNNASVILADLCKRYPSFTDMCIPLICQNLKYKVGLIRYQTIVLLTSLLQDGNILIKCQYSIFFALLSALVDASSPVRQISQYALRQLLPRRNKSLCFDYFIDSIFVLNLFAPPDNERITRLVERFIEFSMPGEGCRKKRMIMYTCLLLSMSVKEKAKVIGLICGIMMNVAQFIYPLNERTECLIRDCFAVLTCSELRLINLQDCENIEDVDAAVGTELLSRKHVIISPVISAISSLKNVVGHSHSNIVSDLILFVKELLSDFSDDLKELLGADKILLQQMEYEMKKDAEVGRRNFRIRKESLSTHKQSENHHYTKTNEHKHQENMEIDK